MSPNLNRILGLAIRVSNHNDVIKWKHIPRYWPFVRGIHRSAVNSPHKGQCRGALMFSLICAWTNCWVNNRDAGDLRRYRAHYDVTVMPHNQYGLWGIDVNELGRHWFGQWIVTYTYIFCQAKSLYDMMNCWFISQLKPHYIFDITFSWNYLKYYNIITIFNNFTLEIAISPLYLPWKVLKSHTVWGISWLYNYNTYCSGIIFLYAPSQWETTLHCSVVSHWLGA